MFINILKTDKTFKWNDVLKSRYMLAGNGYLNQLKEYYRINNSYDLKHNRKLTVILNAFKSKSLDIVKYLIEELQYKYKYKGCFNRFQKYLLYSDKDLLYIATKYGNIEIINYIDSLNNNSNNNYRYNRSNWDYIESFKVAPLSKDIKVLHYIYERIIQNHHCLHKYQIKIAIINSLSVGRIDMVEWLSNLSKVHIPINLKDIEKTEKNLISTAATNGYFDTIKWLHNHSIECFTSDSMDLVAENGYLGIVKWLYHNRSEGCTKKAMDKAAENGHLETIKWLHENRTEGCTKFAIDYAATNGYFEIVKWLFENRTEGSMQAIYWANENGHFEIVRWLRPRCPDEED